MIIPMPMKMPITTSGQAMSPPTIPCAISAIRPACGAGNFASPNPIPPCLMFASCRYITGKNITSEETTTDSNSTH